jgi:hypothetical protein
MIEFVINGNFLEIEKLLAETIGPRKYWLHDKIGGEGWSIEAIDQPLYSGYRISIKNPALATFIKLKLR